MTTKDSTTTAKEPIAFEIFPWHENFCTDISIIDEQHRQLVMLLNKLASHLANRSEEIELNAVFVELAEYADFHFKTEEKIWREYFHDDPAVISHEATHKSFIDEVVALKENKDGESLDDVIRKIVSFLAKWLAYHILDSDKRMAKTVLEIKNGHSIEDATKIATDYMSGSMKLLIETVITMYDSLSTRTMDLIREKSKRQKAEEALLASEERWNFILQGSDEAYGVGT